MDRIKLGPYREGLRGTGWINSVRRERYLGAIQELETRELDEKMTRDNTIHPNISVDLLKILEGTISHTTHGQCMQSLPALHVPTFQDYTTLKHYNFPHLVAMTYIVPILYFHTFIRPNQNANIKIPTPISISSQHLISSHRCLHPHYCHFISYM